MKRWLPTFILTVACAAAPATAPVQAGTGVQRCQAPDGATVYTDKACAAFGAKATALSGELATRILREQAREEELALANGTVASGQGLYADAAAPITGAQPIGRRSVAGGCARTPAQLQMDLRGAFALGDVNRIAESYHWVGVSSRGAARIMDRLGGLARRQVVDTQYFDASIGGAGMYASADDTGIGGSGGVLQVAFADDGGGSITDFDVERYKGCYFVRF